MSCFVLFSTLLFYIISNISFKIQVQTYLKILKSPKKLCIFYLTVCIAKNFKYICKKIIVL